MSGLNSLPIETSPARIANLTSQMAQLSSDYRKQAFAQTQASWPTPPTELEHDFSQDMESDKSMRMLPALKEDNGKMTFGPVLHSPPASPIQGWADKLPPIHGPVEEEMGHATLPPINDTQLFSEPSTIEPQSPLFSQAATVNDRTDSLSPARETLAKPTPIEPEPSFNAIYNIFPQFQGADREFFRKYRQSCYQELKRIPGWRSINGRVPTLPSPPVRVERAFRVVKSKEAIPKTKPVTAKPKIPRVSAAASPVAKTLKTPTQKRERQTASAEPQVRKRAPPSKVLINDDWSQIADYSPPTTSLDSMTNRLKVHWKGVPNDLSADPEVKYLHPQEVEIAQELKLPANQYLANKRRIFEARLKSIRDRKNFTKTAAQQACNIDVNKTSQLFEAYEKVGWFDESNFRQWTATA